MSFRDPVVRALSTKRNKIVNLEIKELGCIYTFTTPVNILYKLQFLRKEHVKHQELVLSFLVLQSTISANVAQKLVIKTAVGIDRCVRILLKDAFNCLRTP